MKRETRVRVGKIGGLISASKLTPAQRTARATANGNTTLQRYGIEYFRALGKLSKKRRLEREAADE